MQQGTYNVIGAHGYIQHQLKESKDVMVLEVGFGSESSFDEMIPRIDFAELITHDVE